MTYRITRLIDILEWGKDADTDNSKKGLVKRIIKTAIIVAGVAAVLIYALKGGELDGFANYVNTTFGM